MLLGAINYNHSLGHMLSFLLASIGHVVMHHSYRNARYVDCQPGQPQAVFAGQPVKLPIQLANPRNHALTAIDVAYCAKNTKRRWNPLQNFSQYHLVTQIEQLPGQQRTLTSVAIPTYQRGWQDLGRLRIASVFPLGLFFCWFFVDINRQVLVYPAPEGHLPLPDGGSSGDPRQLSQQAGRDEFAGFQRYRTGDARHQIAWKALARDDVMRTKQFSQPKGSRLALDWLSVMDINGTEAKLSQLCQWILQAEAAGRGYSLNLPNQQISSGLGDAHRHQCLKALALYGQ
jgi:uncharacterized protein (DUF58 family)